MCKSWYINAELLVTFLQHNLINNVVLCINGRTYALFSELFFNKIVCLIMSYCISFLFCIVVKKNLFIYQTNSVDQNKNRKNLCQGHFKLCKCIKCNFYLKYFFFLHFSDKVYSVHLGVAKSLHLYFFENYTVKVKMYFFFYILYICLSGNKQITF